MNSKFTKLIGLLIVSLSASAIPAQTETQKSTEHPLEAAIRFTEKCLAKVEAVPAYEATFSKREIIGRSLINQTMKVKIRHKPFSVYLYFQGDNEGREVLYVDGQNGGKLVAHESGLLGLAGSMELSPSDPMAMKESRHPITEAGIANAVKQLLAEWKRETKYGETDVTYYKGSKLGSLNCRVIQCSHPQPRKQFSYHKVQLWINDADGFPVRIRKYGFPARAGQKAPVIEEYTFTNLKTSVRLTDADFSRKNSKYSF